MFKFDAPGGTLHAIRDISGLLEQQGCSFRQVRELHFPCAKPLQIDLDSLHGHEVLSAMFPTLERLVLSDEDVPDIDSKGDEAMSLNEAEAAICQIFKKPDHEIAYEYPRCQASTYWDEIENPGWDELGSQAIRYHWEEDGYLQREEVNKHFMCCLDWQENNDISKK
jgi:hypothetical protein